MDYVKLIILSFIMLSLVSILNICFVLWSTDLTGGVRVLLTVASGLARKGHKVTVVALGGDHSWFSNHGIEFRYVEFPNRVRPWMKLLYLLFKLKNPKIRYEYLMILDRISRRTGIEFDFIKPLANTIPECDISIATYCLTAFAVHRSGRGVPVYYMQHYETLFFEDPYMKRMVDETYTLPLHRIANSTWLKNLLKEKFGVDSYGPVVPGVDTRVFYPRKVRKPENTKIIMALGKSIKWKGLWDLFEALRIVKKEVGNVKLLLYGNEPYLCQYSPVECEYEFKPSDDRLAELYSMADVVVMPSWYESSPLPPLEAMACGAPLVTTRYGTEDYCINEYNSLVVEPRNPKEMAKAIIRLLKDESLAEYLRRNGLKTARERTWDKTIETVERILMEVWRRASS